MGIFNFFRKLDRKFWFLCYNCMQHMSHEAVRSIFYFDGPPAIQMGRAFFPCPRCQSTNTVSFQQLKDEGSEAQLWGLEQTVKHHPRSTFEIKPQDVKTTS